MPRPPPRLLSWVEGGVPRRRGSSCFPAMDGPAGSAEASRENEGRTHQAWGGLYLLPGRHHVSREFPSSPRPSYGFQGRVLLSDEQAPCGRVCPWFCAAPVGLPRPHRTREQGPRLPGTAEKCPPVCRGLRTSKKSCDARLLSVHPAQSKAHAPPRLTPLPHTHRVT